eukprot:gnl/MRDRNA2_/MRDRNA2_179237_c0_seq1.p1 gnl/MRDRNA2_/MRDRNA2_179237_c0~~gnl/MRDRNA2_/MRDRNA2_179237_c0_seq1.p1  ORF type:complete len:450 (+),score=108.11 gnl/MRDRNA2_/MRDRNA2_179237_c0_seq1:120-1469(+)
MFNTCKSQMCVARNVETEKVEQQRFPYRYDDEDVVGTNDLPQKGEVNGGKAGAHKSCMRSCAGTDCGWLRDDRTNEKQFQHQNYLTDEVIHQPLAQAVHKTSPETDSRTVEKNLYETHFKEEVVQRPDAQEVQWARPGGRKIEKEIQNESYIKEKEAMELPHAQAVQMTHPETVSVDEVKCSTSDNAVISDAAMSPPVDKETIMHHRMMYKEQRRRTIEEMVNKNSPAYQELAAKFEAQGEAAASGGVSLESCKKRFKTKMDAMTALAEVSPVKNLPADRAITYCASKVGMGSMDAADFLEQITSLVNSVGKPIPGEAIVAAFAVLDFDNTGTLSHDHWTTAVPLFFGESVEVCRAVFMELDDDGSGDLTSEEFARYTTAVVSMMIPPENVQLRNDLKDMLAGRVFSAMDKNNDAILSPEEFIEWSLNNSLADFAMQCLEDYMAEQDRN